jgi:hypothetical protein
MERVLEIIRADVSADKVRVDNPTQNLESYFLDVVMKARAAQQTSGAQSGARVAEYLTGGLAAKTESEKVLEKFTLPAAAPVVAETPVEAKATANETKLAALAQAAPTAQPAKPASQPEKPVDLSKADEKLSSLLGKKK